MSKLQPSAELDEKQRSQQRNRTLQVDILSLFPGYFAGPFDESIIKRARQKGLRDAADEETEMGAGARGAMHGLWRLVVGRVGEGGTRNRVSGRAPTVSEHSHLADCNGMYGA